MANDIDSIRSEKLVNILGKLFVHKNYRDEICELYEDSTLVDSNLKAKAKALTRKILYKIDDKSIIYIKPTSKELSIIKRVFEILKEANKDLEGSIEQFKLKQKEQIFTLATVLLSSGEITWITLKSIGNLLQKDLYEEDDNSTSQQAVINSIAESLFEHVAFGFKKEGIEVEEWENSTEIDVGESPFSLLMEYGILEEFKKDGSSINLKFSKEFEKETKSIYNGMFKFMPPSYEPMIVPPTPWTTIDDGGYIKDETSSPKFDLLIMKSTTKRDKQNVKSLKDTFSPKLLKAVNIIQNTKWQINKNIIQDIQKQLKDTKQRDKIKIKELESKKRGVYKKLSQMEIEQKVKKELLEEIGRDKEEIKGLLSAQDKRLIETKQHYKKSLKEIGKLKNRTQVKELILQKAKKFQDYKEIFFVWQIDFRGRIYPSQVLLNPQGDDFAKALLRFGTQKSLGKNGAKWFKVHGANLYGEDKISFDDRVCWIDEHKNDILSIFDEDNKFENKFLCKADKPYSFLAFAYEYREFIEDSASFKSALPIAMDGSNNGFQHITALLRDVKGAKKVNVLATKNQTAPNDIYKDVAEETKKLILNTECDDEKKSKYIAEILPYITRDLTKKNVMTEVYGAGKGAKLEQIKEYIKDKLSDKLENYEHSTEYISKYLRDMIADAMKQELSSSDVYKKWMQDIAKKISKKGREIRWRTPIICLDVIQEEFKTDEKRVITKYNNKEKSIQIRIPTKEINSQDQKQAIAPNFIHSLDATHLFLTILSSHEKGINSFATIHDSFGTHACDVDTLLESTKQSFIEMFNADILNSLKKSIEKEYGIELESIEYQGSDEEFHIDLVMESEYFFS